MGAQRQRHAHVERVGEGAFMCALLACVCVNNTCCKALRLARCNVYAFRMAERVFPGLRGRGFQGGEKKCSGHFQLVFARLVMYAEPDQAV